MNAANPDLQREIISRRLLRSMGLLVVVSLLLVSYARLTGRPLEGVPADGQIVQERVLRIASDNVSGAAQVYDANGGLIVDLGPTEGGFIADSAATAICRQAAVLGVSAFVVPLTKPELVAKLAVGVPFTARQEFYSPGFGAQKGDPAQFPMLARHYLIMGRSLLAAEDPVQELARVESQLGMGG